MNPFVPLVGWVAGLIYGGGSQDANVFGFWVAMGIVAIGGIAEFLWGKSK